MRRYSVGTIAMLIFALTLVSASPALAAPKFDSLDAAVAYVQQLSAEGRSREEIAAEVTAIVDGRVTNVNSWERLTKWPNMLPFGSYFNTAEDEFDAFRAKADSFDYDQAAAWVWESRYGQCEECASLSYYLLKQAGVDGNVRIFSSAQGSSGHNFVVWGVQDGAAPNDPSTWGPDAYVVDGWQGLTLDTEGATTNRHVSNSGEANVADRTKAHDKTATVWKTDGADASGQYSSDCLMELLFGQTERGDEVLRAARGLRDHVLAASAPGRAFIALYYRASSAVLQPMPRTPPLLAVTSLDEGE
jgi:hypothetical protein